MRTGIWMYSGVFACVLATLAAGNPQRFATNVEEGDATPLPATSLCVQSVVAEAPPDALAIVVLPGPMNNERITYEIWNYASDFISAVNIDGFDALGGQGLLFSRVTTEHAASVGSIRVDYPQNGVEGRGPIILGFGGFGPGQCAAVAADASTAGAAGFHARMMDTVGARIQVVFEGGLRGSGEVLLCGSNGRFFRDVPCHPGDGIALISESRKLRP